MLCYLKQFEWYTKRAALAAVYGTTQFYMIQDNSPDYNNTWGFLNRQLSLMKQAAECSNQVTVGYCKFEAVSVNLLSVRKFGRLKAASGSCFIRM
jgi:ubiquinone biosynthesis protein COQ9